MNAGGFWDDPNGTANMDNFLSPGMMLPKENLSSTGVAVTADANINQRSHVDANSSPDCLTPVNSKSFLSSFQLPGNDAQFEVQQPYLYASSFERSAPAPLPVTMTASPPVTQDVSLALDDLCPVCGDRVSGYHYGLQTCESCKGFFKRTVQNGKVYVCIEKQDCVITKTQRKRCPYCRFQKCLSVGMKLEAVRADRMRGGRNKFGPLYKYDRAVKQHALQQRQQMLYSSNSTCSLSKETSDTELKSPLPSCSPLDVKPDINLLSAYAACDQSLINRTQFMQPLLGSGGPMHCMSETILPRLKSDNTEILDSAGEHSTVLSVQSAGSSPQRDFASGNFQSCYPSRNLVPANRVDVSMTGLMTSAMTSPFGGNTNMMSNISASLSPPVPSPSTPQFPGQCIPQQHHPQLPVHQPQQHPEQWQKLPPESLQYKNTSTPEELVRTSYRDRWCAPANCLPSSISSSSMSTYLPSTSSFYPGLPYPAIPPKPTLTPSVEIPSLIKDLQQNEPSRSDVQQKLGTFVDSLIQQPNLSQAEHGSSKERSTHTHDQSSDGSSVQSVLQIVCRLCDRSLFMLVEWARGACLFKELKVDCQMRLLQGSWSELLILNIVFQQTAHQRTDELLMVTGHRVHISMLTKLGLQTIVGPLTELIRKVRELSLDPNEYSCLKFIILLNPDIFGLSCRELVEQLQERVNTALLEYCSLVNTIGNDRFGQLLMLLHDVRLVSLLAEEFLYMHHLSGNIAENTLLAEMLHSKQS